MFSECEIQCNNEQKYRIYVSHCIALDISYYTTLNVIFTLNDKLKVFLVLELIAVTWVCVECMFSQFISVIHSLFSLEITILIAIVSNAKSIPFQNVFIKILIILYNTLVLKLDYKHDSIQHTQHSVA